MQCPRVPAPRRTCVGAVAGSALVVVVTAVLLPFRDDVTSATPALVLVVPCVLAALVGGRAVDSLSLCSPPGAFNFVFLEPFGTSRSASVDEAIALVVFGLVALTVATLAARENGGAPPFSARSRSRRCGGRTAMQAEQACLAARSRRWKPSTCSAARCCGQSRTTCERRWPPSGRSSPICATKSCTTPQLDRNCSSWSPTRPSGSTASSRISSR